MTAFEIAKIVLPWLAAALGVCAAIAAEQAFRYGS